MASNALVQTRIDSNIKDRATTVLEGMGLTVSDAVRILLTRTANEGALPLELLSNSEAHDTWFRAKVMEALEDSRPDTATSPSVASSVFEMIRSSVLFPAPLRPRIPTASPRATSKVMSSSAVKSRALERPPSTSRRRSEGRS